MRFGSAGGVFLRASHSNFPTAFSLSFAVVKTVHFQAVKLGKESFAQRERVEIVEKLLPLPAQMVPLSRVYVFLTNYDVGERLMT